ncbi:MAG: 1,4-dihydroxy-2-naphthoate octaprenyltransferase [Desulfobacteraceae bacterium]|jgi:1,4-dihydroxy-2-naphthoate octaprenyltransferase|nr:1,4-dihydroxy-2-naphthoate octaprenyltransferase [Desulfobacteraceae bacterium]
MGIYRNWFLASRPWSFAMTAISVGVGGAMAAIDGDFSVWLFLLALTSAVLLHAATNLINDYYDVKNGVDTVEAATAQYRPHPLVEGRLPAEQVRWAAYGLFAAASIIGVYLTATRGMTVLWIGLIGLLAGLTYTAPPLKYKYVALGELSVFLMWGPLMVEGSYFVQRQALSAQAFWVSLPFGALVALVLLANNIRDIDHDRSRKIRTLAIVLGRRGGLLAYLLLMVLAYAGILALAETLTPWVLLIFLTLPLAFKLLRQMIHAVPNDADARTAQLDTAFGVLLVISLVLEGLIG